MVANARVGIRCPHSALDRRRVTYELKITQITAALLQDRFQLAVGGWGFT